MHGPDVETNPRRFAIPFTNSCICIKESECFIEDDIDPYQVPDSVSSLTCIKSEKSNTRLTKSGQSLNATKSATSDVGSALAKKYGLSFISQAQPLKKSAASQPPKLQSSVDSKCNKFRRKPIAEESRPSQRNVWREDVTAKVSVNNLKKVQSVRSGVGLVWRNSRTGETVRVLPSVPLHKSKVNKNSPNVRETLPRQQSAQYVKPQLPNVRNKSCFGAKDQVSRNVYTVKSEMLPSMRSITVETMQDFKNLSAVEKERFLREMHANNSEGFVRPHSISNFVKRVESPVRKKSSAKLKGHCLKNMQAVKSESVVQNRTNLSSVKNVKNMGPSVQKEPNGGLKEHNLKNVSAVRSEAIVRKRAKSELKIVPNYIQQNKNKNVKTVREKEKEKPSKIEKSAKRMGDEILCASLPDYSYVKAKVESFRTKPGFTKRVSWKSKVKSCPAMDSVLETGQKCKSVQTEKSKSDVEIPNESHSLPNGVNWKLPKVAKEIYNHDQRIQLFALRRLSELLLSDSECKRATYEFEIIQRLQNILLRFRIRKCREAELADVILQCFFILALTLRGAIEIAKTKWLMNELYTMAEEDDHSQISACILKVLTQHPVVLKYFIQQTQWFCVLSKIMKNNLLSRLNKKLLEHFSHFIEIHPQMGINNGFFELFLAEIRVRQSNQQMLLKCFALFLRCDEGLDLLEKHDGIRVLYQILQDKQLKTYENVALAIKYATATECRLRNRCQEFPLLVDILIQRAEAKYNKRQQLYCLQILRQITNNVPLKRFVRKRYVPKIRNIESNSKKVRATKKELLTWIRKREKKKPKKKKNASKNAVIKTILELNPFQLSDRTDISSSREV